MNISSKNIVPYLISGWKAIIIRNRLLGFMLWQIIKITVNPVVALREVKRIRKFRSSVHGNLKITKFIHSGTQYYWATDYPGLPTENLKRMITAEFRRKIDGNSNSTPIPQQTIIWGITNRCPLKCRHCYDWDNIDNNDHLTLKQLQQILAKIEQQGIRHIQLSGGEPLVRFDDMITLIEEASKRIDFWLLTSGFGLTGEKAVALKKAGLKGANISLDHWDEVAHNNFRNNLRSYEWVIKAVENCRNAGVMVSLSLCAIREFVTQENLEAYARLARNLGAHFIRILEPRQVGRFSDQKVQLDNHQIELLSEFAIRMNSDPEYRDFPIVSFFGYHQRKLGCMGAGNRYLYIDANADFHACPFCRGRSGNALTGSFNEAIGLLRKNGCHVFNTVSQV